MNAISPIPFEKKVVSLKQVSVLELEEVERLALSFFFPGYHEGRSLFTGLPGGGKGVSWCRE